MYTHVHVHTCNYIAILIYIYIHCLKWKSALVPTKTGCQLHYYKFPLPPAFPQPPSLPAGMYGEVNMLLIKAPSLFDV